ncbi:MAG: mitochondrial fission ELM1 family protein [Alphaproteobacteria bacterium]|nr:mitochondrial fission ELM1 family protein [Alphaproteobacteria bacterium]
MPLVWLLCDDRPGNVNQCIGIGDALGYGYERKNLVYTTFKYLPNFLLGDFAAIRDHKASSPLDPPWPDIVIAAGRRTGSVAHWIKKQNHGNTFIVQCMHPGWPAGNYDLIVVPQHDKPKPGHNIIVSIGAPNHITQDVLARESEHWKSEVAHLPHPRIAMLIGGNSKGGKFSEDDIADLARKASRMAESRNGSLMVTTSRRTPNSTIKALKENFTAPYYFYEYAPDRPNPYPGILGLADAIIVTGDSMSMTSEAATTGKPVYIFSTPSIAALKHQAMHQRLYALGCARPLSGTYEEWIYQPLADAAMVAGEIKARMGIEK